MSAYDLIRGKGRIECKEKKWRICGMLTKQKSTQIQKKQKKKLS